MLDTGNKCFLVLVIDLAVGLYKGASGKSEKRKRKKKKLTPKKRNSQKLKIFFLI